MPASPHIHDAEVFVVELEEVGTTMPEDAVNEDGDKPEKREFCEARGIQYVVLKRTPKEGLPRRQSTDLRGF